MSNRGGYSHLHDFLKTSCKKIKLYFHNKSNRSRNSKNHNSFKYNTNSSHNYNTRSRTFNLFNSKSKLYLLLPLSLASITLFISLSFILSSELLVPSNASATTGITGSNSSGNYYVSLGASDTVSITGNTSNTIAKSTANLTLASNTNSGYKVYVSMASSTANSNRLYLNGTATTDTSKYIAPTTTTSLDNNSWGISLNNSTYQAVPLIGSELLVKEYTSATASATLPVYYGVKTDLTKVAGNYTGKVLYTVLANAPTNTTISPTTTEPAGGGTLTITTPLLITNIIPTATVTIGGTTCTSPSVTKNTNTGLYQVTCTIPAKDPGSYDVVVNYTGLMNNSSASYTASTQLTYINPDITGLTYMQDITGEACANTEEGVTKALLDKRDNQQYTIFKAKDGNCWMQENLRYGAQPQATPTDNPTARAYTSTDAALSDNVNTTNMAKLTTSRISNASGCGSNFSNSTTNYQTPSVCIYQANKNATYDGQTKFGALYNYCAATGGTVCNSSAMSADASGSICPNGWKLPGMTGDPTGSGATTNGTVKTYNNLLNAYGVTRNSAGFSKIIASPLLFVRAGNANNGSLYDRSSSGDGGYWSSTKYTSANSAYNLDFSSSSVYRYDSRRYYGRSVRCVSA